MARPNPRVETTSTVAFSVDKSRPVPAYLQIEEQLREMIALKSLQPEDRLPSEAEIARQCGVSKLTVKRALSRLEQHGVVFRQPGIGTFVSDQRIRQPMSMLVGFTEKLRSRGFATQTQLLRAEPVAADGLVRRELRLASDSTLVYALSRLRSVDGEPVVLQHSFLPAHLFPGLLEHDLAGSLTNVVSEVYGFSLVHYEARIEPVLPTQVEREMLRVKQQEPLLRVEGVTYSANDQPIRFTASAYRPNRFRFVIEGFDVEEKRSSRRA